jgi:fructose-6-phosphate aldolase 2
MQYLLDTANIEDIKRGFDLYPLAGVTTNPTIIAKEKVRFPSVLCDIRNTIGSEAMLHAQVLGRTAWEMVQEAHEMIRAAGEGLYIKIPVVPEGIKAIKQLHKQGIRTTATAVFAPQQALLAAVAGADYVAPYVNRLDNICGDGIGVVGEIVTLLRIHKLPTRVLAASFKNAEQVHRVSLAGSQAVTVNPEIIELIMDHPLTISAVRQFAADWENAAK